jgi:hypothetical protein
VQQLSVIGNLVDRRSIIPISWLKLRQIVRKAFKHFPHNLEDILTVLLAIANGTDPPKSPRSAPLTLEKRGTSNARWFGSLLIKEG